MPSRPFSISDWYDPNKAFSPYHYVTDIPGFPDDLKWLVTGWTVDGAISHRNDPDSPWTMIENANLVERIVLPTILQRLDEAEDKNRRASSTIAKFSSLIKGIRDDLRANKDYARSDSIRDELNSLGFEIKDQK
jgi:cysteinyl-tRNA synthetase